MRKLTNNWKFSIIEEKLSKQFYTHKWEKRFFRTDIVSKLTKNLVTIPSSLWTRYLIKIIYTQRFVLTRHYIEIIFH